MSDLQPGLGKTPVEGGEIAYLVVGEGPPIATAHPYSNPWQGWIPITGCTTISVWPRDFGESSPVRNDEDYGMWRLADDLDAVRRHLGLEKWFFWGTSMGGFTALIYALKYQDTLAGIILDSTAASYDYREDPDSIWPEIRKTEESAAFYQNPNPETLAPFFTRTLALQGYEDPIAAWEEYTSRAEINPYALGAILRRINEFDTREQLGEITIPTLVLWGGKDLQCTLAQAQELTDGIPNATLRTYPETGHGVIRYNPPSVMDEVQAFVNAALGYAGQN